MSIEFRNSIILTGAGFTANYGGFLAKDMWFKIFNNPKLPASIRDRFRSELNFENAYSHVMRGGNNDEKLKFQAVIQESYEDMDEIIKTNKSVNAVKELLLLFKGNAGKTGVCFTLNHDLLLERHMKLPAFGLNNNYRTQILNDSIDRVQLPSQNYFDERQQELLPSTEHITYIKLHGSFRWISSDGADRMVLGINKPEDIGKEPLLRWYRDLFHKALNRDGVRLLVIGYSFRDKHINDLLFETVENHKLKIYVISTEDPQDLKDRLVHKHAGKDAIIKDHDPKGSRIWNAINAYYPHKFDQIFSDQSLGHVRADILKVFQPR